MDYNKFDNPVTSSQPHLAQDSVIVRGTNVLKTFRKVRLAISCGVTLVILIAVAVTVALLVLRKSSTTDLDRFQAMENDMQNSSDPCDDFFKYSCGSYISRNLPYKNRFITLTKKNFLTAKSAMEASAKTSDPVFKKAYNYYTRCMYGYRSMDVFWTAAKEIGGSPITNKGFNFQNWKSDDALIKLKRDYDVDALFNAGIGVDLLNSSRNIFQIKPPDVALIGKVLPAWSAIGDGPKYKDYVLEDDIEEIQGALNNFKDNIKEKFIDDATTKSSQWRSYTEKAVKNGLTFEEKLLKDLMTTMKGLVVHKTYQLVTVSNLAKTTGGNINWVKVLNGIANTKKPQVNDQTLVGLMVPVSYLQKLGKYLSSSYWERSENRDYLPSFFSWTLMKKMSPVLPEDYFAAYFFKAKASDINTEGKEKWRGCLMDTEARMPLTVGMMFTKKVISFNTYSETVSLLNQVRHTFKNGLNNVPWLDDKTRNAVRLKLKYLLHLVANPNLINSTALQARYQNVKSNKNNLGDFFLSCVQNLVRLNMKQLDERPSRTRIGETTAKQNMYAVNAFYDRTLNRITVLAGILQSPFFYTAGPSYMNYGKLASILGHELLHGYDSLGWYFDKTGQIAPWWTTSSSAAFDVRKGCIQKQYSKYLYGSSYVDGKKTLPENIADNGGLKYAYLAYKAYAKTIKDEKKPEGLKSFSYDQLFFLSYAQMWCQAAADYVKPFLLKDTHSPNKYRVIGSLSNFQPFAKAFNCPQGTRMNPVEKCQLW